MSTLGEKGARHLARGFAALSATTLCLIVFGATVRANNAGLACPDWPLCFGELIPRFDAKIALEWGHRVLAGLVTLGFALLSRAILCKPDLREQMKLRLLLAWSLLLMQIVFGGLTVLLKLAPWTVSVHLILGNTFCITLLWLSSDLFERSARAVKRPAITSAIRWLTAASVVCLFFQLLLGGLVSSRYAGLACLDFPTCDGVSLAPTLAGPVGLHVLHRLNGFLLMLAICPIAWLTRKLGRAGKLAQAAFCLILLQIVLGAANVLLRLPFELTALHTGAAAAIALTMALLVRAILLSPVEERAHSVTGLVEAR